MHDRKAQLTAAAAASTWGTWRREWTAAGGIARVLAGAMLCGGLLAPGAALAASSRDAAEGILGATPAGTPVPYSCAGPHDFLVEGGQQTLSGNVAYDHVCVQDLGVLRFSDDSTLRVGGLYVAMAGSINADGTPQDGGCDVVDRGTGGSHLTILAHDATILGGISANGVDGISADLNNCGDGPGGDGTNGGTVTLEAAHLTLQSTVSADGGDGGASGQTPGGAGGTIVISVPARQTSAWQPLLHVSGGADWSGGGHGKDGSTTISMLTSSQLATLIQ